MILKALYDLAEREGHLEDLDFMPKPVAWLVRISPGGRCSGIVGTKELDPENPKKTTAKFFNVPREGGRTSGPRAYFLCDKAEYVFGCDPGKPEPSQKERDKLAEKACLFRDKVRECAEATKDEAAKAVQTFLEELAAGKQAVTLPEDCTSSDLFAFVYDPDVDRLVSEREAVARYWRESRRRSPVEASSARRCLVTGETTSPGALVPVIKRVPGGTSSGVALVSCNARAFESYGWSGAENAVISRQAAEACSTALERLLHPRYPNPRVPGMFLPERNLRLSADTAVVFWSAGASGDDLASALAGLLDANPEHVRELYRSPWRGKPTDLDDKTSLYALTLSGAQGRIILRDWLETPINEAVRNLAQYFEDLAIVRNTPPPRDGSQPPSFSLGLLLESLAPDGDQKKIPPPLAPQMIKAALQGAPYPFSVLQKAVQRARAEVGRSKEAGNKGYRAMMRGDARAALLKAFFNRRCRRQQGMTLKEVTPHMDPSNSNQGYRLGCLMALLERLQQEALQDIKAGVIDRYFSGASAAPRSVFIRLLKNARHHVRKFREKKPGSALLMERLLDELVNSFKPRENGFPVHLNLEEQGLFVLGYHHMRKWLWMSAEERQDWEEANPGVPRAFKWSKQELAAEHETTEGKEKNDKH